ncbi:hypothetical protein NWI01_26810 [Nitrobacter winogradskyi]|uniref:Uncharacterized protein n=1 Tax=Nitrobacter winogradskyi TaxID=913 RepID=A0A4Y3WG76_NITWI|nr:hypothetical protein NWI01_26810 [Nitrobacter winogradskyi]
MISEYRLGSLLLKKTMEFTTDKKGEPLSRRLPFKTDRADVYSWGYLDFYYCNDFLDYHGLRRQSLSASGGI